MDRQRGKTIPDGWDDIVSRAPDGGLLQSRAWGAFQEALGRQVAFLRITNENESTNMGAQTLVVENRLPMGLSYVYSPRGPLFYALSGVEGLPRVSTSSASNFSDSLSAFATEVRRRFPKAIFWRIELPYEITDYQLLITNYRAVRAPRDMQPSTTLVIDLRKSEAELLAAMKQKTRYNIGVANRHAVTVRTLEHSDDLIAFGALLRLTAERDRFSLHPHEYYRKMFATLAPERLELFIAEHSGVMLAVALVAFFGSRAYYLHGGSSSDHREVMAPYLLHWEIIREAKARGCTHYDLWGVDETRWPGVTRFKTGFAPNTKPTTFVGTWDVVLRPVLYRMYRAGARIRN